MSDEKCIKSVTTLLSTSRFKAFLLIFQPNHFVRAMRPKSDILNKMTADKFPNLNLSKHRPIVPNQWLTQSPDFLNGVLRWKQKSFKPI